MKKILMFLIAVFILGGCGTKREAEPVLSTGKEEGNMDTAQGEAVSRLNEVSPLLFQYHVKNDSGKEIKLDFSSSQRFDYLIINSSGEEVFLFSSVSSFLQVLGSEVLAPGEELSYDINVKDVELNKGKYTLNVWMTPRSGKAYSTSIEFMVE
ncbi:BsuPI-related putative proteinase inhibitor [Robertmurraya sp. GLU-23]